MSLDANKSGQVAEKLGLVGSASKSKNDDDSYKVIAHVKHLNKKQLLKLAEIVSDFQVDISIKRSGTGLTIAIY